MNTCHICGGALTVVREVRPFRIGSREAEVEQEFSRCDACGEEFVTLEQAEKTQWLATAEIRRESGLLQSDEIRSVRERLGLSQAAFEQLLGVGQKTVVRWERGTVFQSASANVLIAALREVAGLAAFLARRHGVDIPKHAEASAPAQPRQEVVYAVRVEECEHVLDDLFARSELGVRGMVIVVGQDADVATKREVA